MTRFPIILTIILLSLAVFVPLLHGQEDSFHNLQRQDQEILTPFKDIWQDLPPAQRQRLLRGSQRWTEMSPEQRLKMQEHFQRFRDMSPEQRQELRQRHKNFRELPREEQEGRRKRWQQLPPEKKETLRRRWQQRRLDREWNPQGPDHQRPNRRSQMDGPTDSGNEHRELQRTFMELSPEEKEAIRDKRRQQRMDRRQERLLPIGQPRSSETTRQQDRHLNPRGR